MEYASSDIRFDVPLAEACSEDRQEFCANVPPGSARVIRCLQDRCAPCYRFSCQNEGSFMGLARVSCCLVLDGQRFLLWQT